MPRRSLAPLLALPLALLTACSSSEGTPAALSAPTSSATTAAPADGKGKSVTSSAPSPRAAAASAGTSSQAPVSQSNAGGQPSSVAYKGIPAGSYTYDASGTFSYGGAAPTDASGMATMTVTALKNSRQTTTLRTDQSDTVQHLLVAADGNRLERLTIGAPIDKEFVFSPAALLFPSPAKTGQRWTRKATSTDGKATIEASSTVSRTETLTIGGKSVKTTVLKTRLVISGEVDYTADITSWVVTATRLLVKDHTVGKGTYNGIDFSTDITSVLRSTVPA
jgi:hypothetical protein